MSASSLPSSPVASSTKDTGVTSTTLARKMSAVPQDLGPVLGLGVHADQHQLALHVAVVGEVVHLDDVDQLVQLLDHLLDDELVAAAPPGSCATRWGRASRPPTGSRCCSRAPRTARPRATARRTCSRPAPRSCACGARPRWRSLRSPSGTSPPSRAASRLRRSQDHVGVGAAGRHHGEHALVLVDADVEDHRGRACSASSRCAGTTSLGLVTRRPTQP